jgi:hypothetical protein
MGLLIGANFNDMEKLERLQSLLGSDLAQEFETLVPNLGSPVCGHTGHATVDKEQRRSLIRR